MSGSRLQSVEMFTLQQHTSSGQATAMYKGDEGRRTCLVISVLSLAHAVLFAVLILGMISPNHSEPSKPSIKLVSREDRHGSQPQLLHMPPEQRASYGILNTTLRIYSTRLSTGALTYEGRTYEGMAMGPTLRLKPGDTLVIRLVNLLGPEVDKYPSVFNALHSPNVTNIHVHGMHVSPSGIADNTFRTVEPGTASYSVYKIPPTHSHGLFYYHPHYHGSSLIQTMASMAGCIVVEDPKPISRNLAAMRELILGLQQIRVEGSTSSSYVITSHVMNSTMPLNVQRIGKSPDALDHFTVNGQHQPTLIVSPGEFTRWRLVNAGYSALLNLQLIGCEVYVLAADGVMFSHPRALATDGTVLVSPGSRRELAVKCPKRGSYYWRSVPAKRPHQTHFLGQTTIWLGMLMQVQVQGRRLGMQLPERLPAPSSDLFRDLREVHDVSKFDFVWTKEKTWSVNGHPFSLQVRRTVRLNSVDEWHIKTAVPGGGHPFHLHTNHFQVVSASEGSDFDFMVGDWRDTIMCPVAGTVVIRFRPMDYIGKTLAHCHIFSHHDTGMILTFEIVP